MQIGSAVHARRREGWVVVFGGFFLPLDSDLASPAMSPFLLLLAAVVAVASAQNCSTTTIPGCLASYKACFIAAAPPTYEPTKRAQLCACTRSYDTCVRATGCCSPTFQCAGDKGGRVSFLTKPVRIPECGYAYDDVRWVCSDIRPGECFHESTQLQYGSATFDGLLQLQRQLPSDCSIPHVVTSRGVVLRVRCGGAADATVALRLTAEHLVYTQRGRVAARSVVAGQDKLYGDLAEQRECQVLSVDRETAPQRYFGLACKHSDVLAQGVKVSTFANYHVVPALWMRTMGSLLGAQRAAAIGDWFASFLKYTSD